MKLNKNNRNAGFTLIELMLSMVVTMVLLYAAFTAFRDASQSNQQVTMAADMTGNLRAGLDLIQQDLIQAGAGGIPNTGIPIPYTSNGSSTAPCNTNTAPRRPILNGTTGFPICNSVLPAISPGSMMGPPITAPDAIAGTVANPNSITDEITIIYGDNNSGMDLSVVNRPASGSVPACNGTISVNGQQLTFDTSAGCFNPATASTPIGPGDLVMFSNTLGTALQYITSGSGATFNFAPGDPFGLNGRTDPNGTILQLQNPGCTTSANCWPPTLVTRIWMVTYYLDNVADPQHVRLIRQVNMRTPTAVGETLENLQFTYNFIDGLTNPTNQTAVPAGDNESQIRSVNVYLGARSSYPVRQGMKSIYARSNLMTQVSLRSLAFVNKYQ